MNKKSGGVAPDEVRAGDHLSLEIAEKYRLLASIGQKLASAPDRESLLRLAVSCLRHDFSYEGARLHLIFHHRERRPESRRLFTIDPPTQVVVPIVFNDNELGRIVIPLHGRPGLSDFDREVLSTFAAFVAVGVRNVQRLEEFHSLASIDALTGVLNRRKLLEIGRQRLKGTRGTGLIVFDIDWLKRINDVFGHLAGDALLKAIAQRAKACTRKIDFLIRYGGDEFVILLPNTTLESVSKVAERVRIYVESTTLEWNGESIRSTISVGAACVDGDVDLHTLLSCADEALLEAKRSGRNAVRVMSNRSDPPPDIDSHRGS